jgi:hypothetical protein
MRRVRGLALVCLVACGGGLGRDAGPLDGGVDGAAAGACPLAGEWRLQRIACGAQDMTADYVQQVPTTLLTVEASGTGCRASLAQRSDFCTKTETFSAEVTATAWIVTSNGFTECLFEGCSFGFADPPCRVGEGAGRRNESLMFGATTFTSARFGGGTICAANVAQIVTWGRP